MATFKPSCLAKLTVPVYGSSHDVDVDEKGTNVVDVTFVPRSVHLEKNDHNHADVCRVRADWKDAGIDPRFLRNATVQIWIGNSAKDGKFYPKKDNLRFIGIAVSVKRDAQEDSGQIVEIEFHDYTNFFLRMKPYPSDGYPNYSMTLQQAWETICDHVGYFDHDAQKIVSTVGQLRGKLSFFRVKNKLDFAMSAAIPERFVKFDAKIQPNSANEDAWAVWQRCVNSLGLISFIRINKLTGEPDCVVTDAANYYTIDDYPFLVWGKNLSSMSEVRNAELSGKPNVMIRSFNPLEGSTLEAIYPPISDPTVKKKKVNARARNPQSPETSEDSSYEVFDYPSGISTQAQLDELAQRVYEERSRQELEGIARTSDMFIQKKSDIDGTSQRAHTSSDPRSLDILSLNSGDVIKIQFDQDDIDRLRTSTGSNDQKVSYLVDRGYSEDIARLILKNMAAFDSVRNLFYIRKVEAVLETDETAGDFYVQITYVNRILTDGSTDLSAKATDALSSQSLSEQLSGFDVGTGPIPVPPSPGPVQLPPDVQPIPVPNSDPIPVPKVLPVMPPLSLDVSTGTPR